MRQRIYNIDIPHNTDLLMNYITFKTMYKNLFNTKVLLYIEIVLKFLILNVLTVHLLYSSWRVYVKSTVPQPPTTVLDFEFHFFICEPLSVMYQIHDYKGLKTPKHQQ